jgi:predicted transcriptional regulator
VPVGTACRQCLREDCRHRAFPAAVHVARSDEEPGDRQVPVAVLSPPTG